MHNGAQYALRGGAPMKSFYVRILGPGMLRTDLARGTIGSFSLKVFYTVLAFAISIVLARALTPSGYGIYSFAYSLISIFAIPTQLGIPTLVVREVARYHGQYQWDLLRGILQRATQTVILLSLLVAIITPFITDSLANTIEHNQLQTILWALPLVPLLAFNQLRQAALQGFGHPLIGQLPEMVFLPVLLFAFFGVSLVFHGLTPPQTMVLYSIASAITFFIGTLLLLKQLPPNVKTVKAQYDTANWARSVLPLSLIGGMSVITTQTDIFMLGLLATDEEVGLYRVATSGASLVVFTLTAVNIVLAPHVARLYNSGDHARLQRVATLTARLILATALPTAGILILLGRDILAFVYGEEYRQSYGPLAVLCLGQIANAGMGSVALILNMTGHERDTLKGVTLSAVLNILLNATLIPSYGSLGAAMATATTLIAVNVILSWQVWKRTGIQSAAFCFSIKR